MMRLTWLRVAGLVLGLIVVPGLAAAQTLRPGQGERSNLVPSPSAESTPPAELSDLKLGLTFEGFYEYNWTHQFDRINLLRAYDTRANTFGIQQAAIVLEFPTDVSKGRRYGGRLDLQFGQATETVQGNPSNEPRPDAYRHVWQAYGTYVFDGGRGLQMDFGKFASSLGIETNYAKDNDQFSRAYQNTALVGLVWWFGNKPGSW